MIEFSLFRIPVKVETSFWISIGILAFLSYGISSSEAIFKSLLFVLAAFGSVLTHEMGHALVIRKFNMPTEVVLTTLGGYATYPTIPISRRLSISISIAGPALQILAAILVYIVQSTFFSQAPVRIQFLLSTFVLISLIWAIFNCLPVLPLDGGRILESFLGRSRIKTTYLVSFIVAITVTLFSMLAKQFFLTALMGMMAYQNYQAYQSSKY